jgi:hypothetical protein
VTGFPRECLLADPGSVTYEALGLVKGVRQTFFGSEVSWVCVAGWGVSAPSPAMGGVDSSAGIVVLPTCCVHGSGWLGWRKEEGQVTGRREGQSL